MNVLKKWYVKWLYLGAIHLLAVMTIMHYIYFLKPISIPLSKFVEVNIQSTPIDSSMTLGKFCYNLRESFDNVFDSTLKDQSYFRPVRRVCVYFRLDDQLITVFADGGFHPCNSCDTFTLVRANIIQDFVSKEFLFDGSSFVTRSGMTVSEYLTFNEEKGGGIITKQDLISPSKED